jgi:hypothetical protein
MSYIGKNPEADSVKLKGSATEPSGTAVDGQVYFNTGAGSISKGMKVYKNSQFVAIDKQLGDADTMQLLKAADIPAIDFNLSYTSTTVGGQGAVPFESSTGDFDGTAAFTNSSTGDALLTDDSADLVFHYTTQATNSADNDFWGIPLTVPRAFRGGNLVLEFKYRTEIASGTMDDGYFNIAVQDRSSMILQTCTAATAIAAGADVTLAGKTYANPVTSTTLTVAVGDRVFVESGTGTVGDQANDIVDCYITAVSSTANTVKLSKDIVSVANGKFVTGWLTGYDTGGQISAFASDTNKDGTSKKIAFKTDADTQQVSLWFFVKGTSTVKHELFFDNVLLSGNQFLQASSQTKPEFYGTFGEVDPFWDSATAAVSSWDITSLSPGINTPPLAQSKYLSITDISTDTVIEAKQDIKLDISFGGLPTTSEYIYVQQYGTTGTGILAETMMGGTGIGWKYLTTTVMMNKGDQIKCHRGIPGGTYDNGSMNLCATPQTSDVVLLESQDEIFTDWTDYSSELSTTGPANATNTGTTGTYGGSAVTKAFWRRIGGEMEVNYSFQQSTLGGASTGKLCIPLPSGYSIDISKLDTAGGGSNYSHAQVGYGVWSNNSDGVSAATGPLIFAVNAALTTGVFWANWNMSTDIASSMAWGEGANGNTFNNCFVLKGSFKVPISGWNANFNPLLSLPLVNVGNDWEYYRGGTFSANSNSPYSTAVYDDTSGSLFSVISNSTDGFRITCVQRCNMNAGFTFSAQCGTDMGRAGWVLNETSATAIQSVSAEYNVASSQSSFYGVETQQINVNRIMEPGDTLEIRTNGYLCNGALWKVSVTAQKDRGNTNMAHIIKPAVAVLRQKKVNNSGGDTILGSSGWQDMVLNTISGESWFVTLTGTGTTGVGGTNVDFTLEAGTYEMLAQFSLYNCGNYRTRLVDSAGTVIAISSSEDAYANQGYMPGHAWFMETFTITSSTEFTFQTDVESNGDCGVTTNMGYDEIFSQVMIRKLK